uniref:Uncharacterized protein n=1 Tax=Clandestinovirus TaxID=2831644 RepID=A0A8F8KNU0_9VIRU|nr:hypothetical protein KOM_12_297 [Clandestinovirus]
MLSEDVWFRIARKLHPLEASNLCVVSSRLYNNVIYPIVSTSDYPIKLFKCGYSKWEDNMQYDVSNKRWCLEKMVESTLGQTIKNRRYFISMEPILRNKKVPKEDFSKWLECMVHKEKWISPAYAVMEMLTTIKVNHSLWDWRIYYSAEASNWTTSAVQKSAIIELYSVVAETRNVANTPKMMYVLAFQGSDPFKKSVYSNIDYDKLLRFMIPLCPSLGSCKPFVVDCRSPQDFQRMLDYMTHALMSGEESTMYWVWDNYITTAFKGISSGAFNRRFIDKLIECCSTHLLTNGIEFLSKIDALPDYYTCILLKSVIHQLAQTTEEPPFDNELYAWLYTHGMLPGGYGWRMDAARNRGRNLMESWITLLRWSKSLNKTPNDQLGSLLNAIVYFGLPSAKNMLKEEEMQWVVFQVEVMALELGQDIIDGLRTRGYL